MTWSGQNAIVQVSSKEHQFVDRKCSQDNSMTGCAILDEGNISPASSFLWLALKPRGPVGDRSYSTVTPDKFSGTKNLKNKNFSQTESGSPGTNLYYSTHN